MLTVYPYEKLGHANHGWLDARHHFSFADYYNKDRMDFGVLRVINDDTIKAGAGFGMHPHQNMEIITYVRSGAITHTDNRGNEGRTAAGDVQVMSAGTGIYHSERNLESEDTTLYQIWIEPNKINVEPRWDAHEFPTAKASERLQLLVANDDRAPLQIHQDAYIYAGQIDKGNSVAQPIKHQAYILVSAGSIDIDGQRLSKGDGAEMTEKSEFTISASEDAEVLVLDVPERARH